MPVPENLPEIVGVRDRGETCSQFVFGEGQYYVDEAFRRLVSIGCYQLIRGRGVFSPAEEDIVFYGSPFGNVSHVGRIDNDGLVVSKFDGDPKVYRHEIWGNPIPLSPNFARFHLFRKIKGTHA
jgi:hypothetical protein